MRDATKTKRTYRSINDLLYIIPHLISALEEQPSLSSIQNEVLDEAKIILEQHL